MYIINVVKVVVQYREDIKGVRYSIWLVIEVYYGMALGKWAKSNTFMGWAFEGEERHGL